MRALAAIASLIVLAACEAQSGAPAWRGQDGWRMGAYDGPMMHYGYCPGAPAGAGGAERGWHGPGMMAGGGMMGGRGEEVSTWLDSAKQQIGITAAQEPAWSAYVQAAQADRSAIAGMHAQMHPAMAASENAPARLQAHVELMEQRVASLRSVEAATRALYGALTPEQRERADRALWSGCW